uniref:Uncharacterized protein n=1 Tax=Globodera rostochiensis TaxID=31243 RepID=A0A914H953_GLORO
MPVSQLDGPVADIGQRSVQHQDELCHRKKVPGVHRLVSALSLFCCLNATISSSFVVWKKCSAGTTKCAQSVAQGFAAFVKENCCFVSATSARGTVVVAFTI